MNLRQAAEQALEALEQGYSSRLWPIQSINAIQALRQALAQSEQEPVAYKEECWACGCEECICATKVPGYYESKIKEAVLAEPVAKVWLWRNFVNDKPEYWAFDNPYPINLDNDDPQTIGSPCGYAILKPSRDGSRGRKEDEVLREIKGALVREQTRSQALAQPEQGNNSPNYPITESNTQLDKIVELAIQGHASTRDAIRWAMQQEREACARVLEGISNSPDMQTYAAAIRARGEK